MSRGYMKYIAILRISLTDFMDIVCMPRWPTRDITVVPRGRGTGVQPPLNPQNFLNCVFAKYNLLSKICPILIKSKILYRKR